MPVLREESSGLKVLALETSRARDSSKAFLQGRAYGGRGTTQEEEGEARPKQKGWVSCWGLGMPVLESGKGGTDYP